MDYNNKIRLYINGSECDLGNGEDSLLLFTYAAGDLTEPAVVQNSFSKDVVLPPTTRNVQALGALWRTDWTDGEGGVQTLSRIPFELRSNAGEVLESGYVKVQRVSRTEGYTVQLFGGLGAFLYGLMYREDGEQRTLADMTFGDAIDRDLTFTINAARVRSAWAWLYGSYDPDAPLTSAADVVQFAPMHNGIPSDFDAQHALVRAGDDHGCPLVGDETGHNGWALVDFGKEVDEWDVRDLRSYLQRPVLNIRSFLAALGLAQNIGGDVSFDWTDIADKWYTYTWMTLPMLHNSGNNEELQLTLNWPTTVVPDYGGQTGVTLPISIAETLPVDGPKVRVSLGLRLAFNNPSAVAFPLGISNRSARVSSTQVRGSSYCYVRLFGLDSNSNIVARSKIVCVAGTDAPEDECGSYAAAHLPGGRWNTVLTGGGHIPTTAADFTTFRQGELTQEVGTGYVTDVLPVELEGYNIASLALAVIGNSVIADRGDGWGQVEWTDTPYLYEWSAVALQRAAVAGGAVRQSYATATAQAPGTVRSGSTVTKADLLGGTPSPASLLLSLVKTFGLMLTYDGVAKRVRVLERGTFYTGETVDISARVDRTQRVAVEPNGIEQKWLRFAFNAPTGAFAERYRAQHGGREYGAQTVDTGSPFNAETLQVLDGVTFVQGITGLAQSRYYWLLEDLSVGNELLPSPFLDNDCTYTLWTPSGDAVQHDVAPISSGATLTPINADAQLQAPGYDGWYRLQLAGPDGQAADDGSGVLLFHDGDADEYVSVSDDNQTMLDVNGGVPCWIPNLLGYADQLVPHFTTYRFDLAHTSMLSGLDMGAPAAVDFPAFEYKEDLTIYARRWRAYIAERYNANAHRVTCRVDWGGMQVGQEMLGRFYWFDGCLWALEAVRDWCWNDPQPCECTFVRVLTPTAYTG